MTDRPRKNLSPPWAWLLITLLAAAGCSDPGETSREGDRAPPPAPSPGLWQGTFPCADCPGIEVTLWLRPAGAYFLRQHYLANDGDGDGDGDGERYYGLGRWVWDANESVLRLGGGGPERVFEQPAPGRLAMRVASELPHALERSGELVPFTDTLTLEGEYEGTAGAPRFRECRSDLVWQVVRRGDYRRLVHQYGRLPRGEQALVKVRGRLEQTADGEALVIEELVQLQPGRSCP